MSLNQTSVTPMRTYQTHDEEQAGISNTKRKLERLKIPSDLSGKRVLDIGCNEGYFCNLARARGAKEVIGIDYVPASIEFAKAKYPREGISFLCRGWDKLPDGPFDLMIWSSAMHYESDAAAIARKILERLAPGGLFILECGVLEVPGSQFVPVPRVADTRWYPTKDYLIDSILHGFSVRQVASPEIAEGDFVPRSVFHCTRALPIVMLVRGQTGAGKSWLARTISNGATKVLSLDLLVSKLGVNKFPHDALERFAKEAYDPGDLGKIYNGIDQQGLTEDYVAMLSKVVAASDKMVVIEGFMTDLQRDALAKRLSGKAAIWDTTRLQ